MENGYTNSGLGCATARKASLFDDSLEAGAMAVDCYEIVKGIRTALFGTESCDEAKSPSMKDEPTVQSQMNSLRNTLGSMRYMLNDIKNRL